jgi:hypothetical protein
MVIVESLILPLGQLHDPFDYLVLDLSLTRPSAVAMNYSFGALPNDSCLEPVTLPFADADYHRRFDHTQIASKYSLYNL